MKSKTPLISIIIPVFNVEKYLHRCLDSIIKQTYTNLEIILVNDGSTDNSGKICDDFSKTDKRIKVIHQSNKGLSGARNTGLTYVNGDYIGFVDSDDWVEPSFFEAMLQTITTKDVDIVECNIQKANTKLEFYNESKIKKVIIENRNEAITRIIKNQSFSVWRRIYKTKLVSDIRFIEGKNSEDVYYTLEVFDRISNIALIDNKLYNYFIGGNSITRGAYRLKTLDSVEAAIYLTNRINKNETDANLKKSANLFLLKILLYNYKLLNINNNLDSDKKHRLKIKKLIENHYDNPNGDFQLFLAKIMPIPIFQLGIKLKNSLSKK